MSYILALQEIEKFTKTFKAFEEAKNAINTLVSLDQNVQELEKKRIDNNNLLSKETEELNLFHLSVIKEKEKIAAEHALRLEQLNKKYEQQTLKLEEEYNQTKKLQEKQLLETKFVLDKVNQDFLQKQKEVLDKTNELTSLENKVIEVRKQIVHLLKD